MCRRVQGSQIFKQNWIISIHSRVIVIVLIWFPWLWGSEQVGGGCPEWSAIVYMSSGMFSGKESSNRIKLSRLIQELLNFGVLGSLQLWGWGVGRWGWGVVGGCPPHMCTHMHMHTHVHVVNMIISCKWLLPLDFWGIPGNSIWCHMCMHVCACACMCMYVGAPSHHPHPIHPPPHPQGGDSRNHSKFNSTWTNQDISILF